MANGDNYGLPPGQLGLYRAHSTKYLSGTSGLIGNPNIGRTRRPRDTPLHIHETLCAWFSEEFGMSYRELGLFCTGDREVAKGYVKPTSTLIRIEPVGDFSVCYSEVCKDLFAHCQFRWIPNGASAEVIRSDLESFNYIQLSNTGLQEAARTNNEAMIYAERFRYAT